MGRFVKGWVEDSADLRDKHYYDHAYQVERMAVLPPSVDLRPFCPSVYDQGNLGSCTANALAGMIEFLLMKQQREQPSKQEQPFTPSRLFIYYNERALEGTVNEDDGAMIRDGIKCVVKQGACPETEWPYSDDGIQFKKKPLKQCYTDALLHQVLSYQRVIGLTQMKTCLAAGYPFNFGFQVYSSFESQEVADTGVMPFPQHGEQYLGGHAIMAVGYDDASQRLLIRNSWSADWGGPMQGYFTMPYSYAVSSKYCNDFWTIRSVE